MTLGKKGELGGLGAQNILIATCPGVILQILLDSGDIVIAVKRFSLVRLAACARFAAGTSESLWPIHTTVQDY